MWDKSFKFTLTANESEEMHGQWDTMNFKPRITTITIPNMDSIEGAITEFKEKCTFSNGDWDWDSNEEGTVGEIRTGNDEDGLSLTYKIELL